MAPSGNARIERKDQFLEQFDPEHAAGLDGTFMNRLAAAIRAGSPSEYQQACEIALVGCRTGLLASGVD